MPEICTEDRDALIECEAPRVKACIDACRELDAEDPVAPGEGIAVEICPESPVPCERLCWEIDARAALLAGGDDAEDVDLATLGRPLITCARDGARRCIQEAAGAPPANAPVTELDEPVSRMRGAARRLRSVRRLAIWGERHDHRLRGAVLHLADGGPGEHFALTVRRHEQARRVDVVGVLEALALRGPPRSGARWRRATRRTRPCHCRCSCRSTTCRCRCARAA